MRQCLNNNLLSYDALGCAEHLRQWLHMRQPCRPEEAQILAIKYEHLWEQDTINAIKSFLQINTFELPPRKKRGRPVSELNSLETTIKQKYNLGTEDIPIYRAYDEARAIWEKALPFEYFNLRLR